jgi:hypothetical protein
MMRVKGVRREMVGAVFQQPAKASAMEIYFHGGGLPP